MAGRNPSTFMDGTWFDRSIVERMWDDAAGLPGRALNGAKEAAGDLLASSRDTAGELAGNMVGEGMEIAGNALTSEFMKNYGYVGAAVLVYMTLFKGTGFKTAALVAGVASMLFGQFVKPYLSQFFNRASGADTPGQNLASRPEVGDPSFVAQGPNVSHGVPTNLQLAANGPAHELE